jgi:hypothetical protein
LTRQIRKFESKQILPPPEHGEHVRCLKIGVEEGQELNTVWDSDNNFWRRLLKDVSLLKELWVIVNPVMYGNLK